MTRTTALALVCAFSCCASAPAGLTVTLKSRATPTSSVVHVGDVASVAADSPADAAAANRLRSVPLTPAPAEGQTATLSATTLRERVAAGGFQCTLAGAKSVTLTAAGTTAAARPRTNRPASAGDMSYATKFVTAAVSRALTRSGVGSMGVEVALDADAARTIARQRPDGCDLTGLTATPQVPQTITLRWLDRLERVVTVDAAVRLSPPRLVPVLTEPIPRGAPITPDHVVWRPENAPLVKPIPTVPPVGPPAGGSPIALASGNQAAAVPPSPAMRPSGRVTPTGFDGAPQRGRLPTGEAIRDLPAGAVVDENDLRQAPLVRSNQMVRVESRVGGVTVSRDLKANRDGLLGQTIPLSDPDRSQFGRDRIYARVIGNRRAVLVGDGSENPAYAATEDARSGGRR